MGLENPAETMPGGFSENPSKKPNKQYKYTYAHTRRACYMGYITQAVINNLAPLLFIIFRNRFGLSLEETGRLILINFGVQLIADVLAVKCMDTLGWRRAALLAHVFCVLGLICLGVLPNLLPSPYLGLILAVVVCALGGGLLEVLVSPIVEALPSDNHKGAMSLLHSFYCWGQVATVLLSTLFLQLLGENLWMLLPFLWALVPLWNLFRFRKVPIEAPSGDVKMMSLRELLSHRVFIVALLLMLCSGASELTMSQWSSLFAEQGLRLPKVLGDILGPCLFAVFMGIGRTVYGIRGEKLNLRLSLLFCGVLCTACYLTAVFSPWPFLSLFGCAFCGLAVSLMWPGTFSLSAAAFPRGGSVMFGLLAVFGDLGGSLGPWLAGVVSDAAEAAPQAFSFLPAGGAMKYGILAGVVFPLLMILGAALFSSPSGHKSKTAGQNENE